MKIITKGKKQIIFICIVIFLISILSITNGSMWGDEICRVFDPITGNFVNTLKTSLKYAQPGYMLYMYLWERITFSSSIEFIIRCSNLVFVPIAIYYCYKIVKAKNWNLWTILLFFIHPMFVYYMDEATPYIIVYAFSLAFIYYVFFSDDFNSTSNIVKINIIYLLGVFFHFMFGFIIVLYVAKCLIGNKNSKKDLLKHITIISIFSIIYIPLLLIYLINLVPTNTGFGIKNIAYIIYGFIGMSGIGLSRNDLRALNFNNITILQIVSLFMMTVACVGLIYFIIKNFKKIVKETEHNLIYLMVYFIVILLVAFAIKFGVWERHCFTIFPLFMIILIDIFKIIRKNKTSLVFISLYMIVLVISSINIRFNYYYQCDDYKGVYNYLKDIKNDSYYFITYHSTIYNPKDFIDENHYIDVTEESKEEIIDNFQNKSDSILILFEKDCSKSLYTFFDNNKDYTINDKFNSFKIVEHKGNEEK